MAPNEHRQLLLLGGLNKIISSVCLCCTGAVRCQSDASPEVHQSLEEPSSAAAVHSAGLHEDARESWASAHIQAERRLDWTL